MPDPAVSRPSHQTTPYDLDAMPPGVPFIVGNEAAERFSFYGMKSILAVFMTEHLLNSQGQLAVMTDESATAWIANFNAAVYFTPFLGAFLADWLWGKYRTIISLSLLYCVGHAILALIDTPVARSVEPRTILWFGLAVLAVGAGGVKPCVSAHVGDQFGARNQHLIPKVFGWFYFSINFGSTFAFLLIPELLKRYGPSVAFGLPGIVMAIATVFFWMGRNHFVHIPAGGSRFLKEVASPEGRRAIFNLAPLILFVAMFWTLFDQTSSRWVLQARNMDLDLGFWTMLPSQTQFINPVLVMTLVPLLNYLVYPLLNRWFTLTPLRKIGLGLFLAPLAFVVSALIEQRISAGETPHFNWQLLGYFIITTAEVLASITSLEFAYTQAPKSMKSLVMSLYLLSVTLGNVFTAQVNYRIEAWKAQGYEPLSGANYYWFFAGCALVTAVLFVVWSRFYRGQTYIQGVGETGDESDAG